MQYYHYINSQQKKDGPHDLVTIMRRIRSGAIIPDTLICQGEELIPAYRINELSSFFNNPVESMRQELNNAPRLSLIHILDKGWHFTAGHQNMSVLAGAILLLAVLVGILTYEISHNIATSIMTGWIMFLIMQSAFLVVSLRIYRGQNLNLDFLDYTLAPLLGKLSLISVLFAFITMAGLPLLIIPSAIAMLICTSIPMIALDYNLGAMETIKKTYGLLKKLDTESQVKLSCLMLLYLVCIALIFPIPLAMPILAGGLYSFYEESSAS